MYTVTNSAGQTVSSHSSRKKAISRAKRLVFKGLLPFAKVECKFRGSIVTRTYSA